MTRFNYRAVSETGVEKSGTIEAPGLFDASLQLRGEELQPLSIESAEPPAKAEAPPEAEAFILFNRSLAQMARLGMPLPTGLRELATGLGRGRFRNSVERVEAQLREGKTLQEAVEAAFPDLPPHYGWTLKAGIEAGNLPGALSAVVAGASALRRARRAVVEALSYPALILVVGFALTLGFLGVVVPLYRELHQAVLLEGSWTFDGILAPFDRIGAIAFAGLAVAIAAWAAVAWLRRSLRGERLLFRLPVVGRVWRSLCSARFLSTLGALLKAGARPVSALPVAMAASGSRQLLDDAARAVAMAKEGAPLGEILRGLPVLQPSVTVFLAFGETGGRLPEAASELGDYLLAQVSSESETLLLYLYPAAMLAVGTLMGAAFTTVAVSYAGLLERIGR